MYKEDNKTLISKTVLMRWNSANKKWCEDKGYLFTKYKEEFEIKVEDLSDGSHTLVDVECDGCGEILKGVVWKSYKHYVHEDGKYYCNKCSKNGYKKSDKFL